MEIQQRCFAVQKAVHCERPHARDSHGDSSHTLRYRSQLVRPTRAHGFPCDLHILTAHFAEPHCRNRNRLVLEAIHGECGASPIARCKWSIQFGSEATQGTIHIANVVLVPTVSSYSTGYGRHPCSQDACLCSSLLPKAATAARTPTV